MWDYKKKFQKNSIYSAFYRGDDTVLDEYDLPIESVCMEGGFRVSNGCAVIKYGQSNLVEVIHCNQQQNHYFLREISRKVEVIGDDVFFINDDFIWCYYGLKTFKKRHEIKTSGIVEKGTRYLFDTNEGARAKNAKARIYPCNLKKEVSLTTFVGGLVFGFCWSKKPEIIVMNTKGKVLKTVDGVFKKDRLSPNLLEKLVKACKEGSVKSKIVLKEFPAPK